MIKYKNKYRLAIKERPRWPPGAATQKEGGGQICIILTFLPPMCCADVKEEYKYKNKYRTQIHIHKQIQMQKKYKIKKKEVKYNSHSFAAGYSNSKRCWKCNVKNKTLNITLTQNSDQNKLCNVWHVV